MKFLHTADWQIGMRAAHAQASAARVRDERLTAARRTVEAACEHQVDFMLLAGDTFEDNGVDRALVQRIALTLAEFDRPVYILPGNHDPLVPGSVWDHPCWAESNHLHVIQRAEPLELPGGRLYPCPVFEKHSSKDPTTWIDAHGEVTIAIGLAHGSIEGVAQDQVELPIPRNAADRGGLDYLALGHWHSTDATSYGRIAYSGTHETTRFDERDSGNVLVVEIAGRHATPRITSIHTGGLQWISRAEEIRAEGDLGRLRRSLESLDQPERTLLRLSLHGVLHANEMDELKRIEESLAARDFLFHRVDTSQLLPAPENDRWLADLPAGPIRETARRLHRWAESEALDERPDYATPQVAARALLELFAMCGGGRR